MQKLVKPLTHLRIFKPERLEALGVRRVFIPSAPAPAILATVPTWSNQHERLASSLFKKHDRTRTVAWLWPFWNQGPQNLTSLNGLDLARFRGVMGANWGS